jgi:uncharacterized membrane protein (UPF0182 family)
VVFVQPTYSWRAQGSPTIARVGLLMDDSVRTGASLAQLAGALPTPNIPAMPSATADIRARAAALYSRMRDALRRGDWMAFGQAFDELGKLLAGSGTR